MRASWLRGSRRWSPRGRRSASTTWNCRVSATCRSSVRRFGIRAFAALGDLAPADICVEVLHGRVDANDEITDPARASLSLAETYEGNRHRYEGELKLDRTGPFGYTVRVVPNHAALASVAELGLAAGARPTPTTRPLRTSRRGSEF